MFSISPATTLTGNASALLPALALTLFPTAVWILILLWIRPRNLSLSWLLAGCIAGVLLGGPVWLAESAVDVLAGTGNRYWQDFTQQVAGAACCEESLKFVAICLLIWLARRTTPLEPRTVVAISISVGVGFMTLENLFAVNASESPIALALDRQLTILAGHGSYQAIMGVFLAISIQRRQWGWAAAALLVPLFLHGWGNLADQMFRDEPDPDSFEDAWLYNTWIGSIITTTLAAYSLLWWIRRSSNPEISPVPTGDEGLPP